MTMETKTVTEAEFYAAVKVECDKAGIDQGGRWYVEMTCMDNADIPSIAFEMALDTLRFFVACGDLEKAARNEM